jgi:hypothetical protein
MFVFVFFLLTEGTLRLHITESVCAENDLLKRANLLSLPEFSNQSHEQTEHTLPAC